MKTHIFALAIAIMSGHSCTAVASENVINLPEVLIVTNDCEIFAELHYAMAESISGEEAYADAAYEDAYAMCTDDYSYKQAVSNAQHCPTDNANVQVIAGGWVGVCLDGKGRTVGYAGRTGMQVVAR